MPGLLDLTYGLTTCRTFAIKQNEAQERRRRTQRHNPNPGKHPFFVVHEIIHYYVGLLPKRSRIYVVQEATLNRKYVSANSIDESQAIGNLPCKNLTLMHDR